jgi:hypothetical protein
MLSSPVCRPIGDIYPTVRGANIFTSYTGSIESVSVPGWQALAAPRSPASAWSKSPGPCCRGPVALEVAQLAVHTWLNCRLLPGVCTGNTRCQRAAAMTSPCPRHAGHLQVATRVQPLADGSTTTPRTNLVILFAITGLGVGSGPSAPLLVAKEASCGCLARRARRWKSLHLGAARQPAPPCHASYAAQYVADEDGGRCGPDCCYMSVCTGGTGAVVSSLRAPSPGESPSGCACRAAASLITSCSRSTRSPRYIALVYAHATHALIGVHLRVWGIGPCGMTLCLEARGMHAHI